LLSFIKLIGDEFKKLFFKDLKPCFNSLYDTLKEYTRRHPEKADEIISKLKSYNLLNENGAPRFGDNSIYRNQYEEILKAINDKDIC
jgi:hypothetical protein